MSFRYDYIIRLLLLFGAVFAARGLMAADIYRWTDADGQVHYGQRAPGHADATKIDAPQGGSRPPAVDADNASRRARQQRLLDAYAYEREQKRAEAAQAAQKQRARASRCSRIKTRWRALSHPGPIFTKRADGGRDYISDEQRAARLSRLRPAYIEACGEAP